MYPLFNEDLALYRQQELLREAEVERKATLARKQSRNNKSLPRNLLTLAETPEGPPPSAYPYERKSLMSGYPVVLQNVSVAEPDWAAIRQDVQIALADLRYAGPDDEDRLVDVLIDRLRCRLRPARILLFVQPFPVHLWLLLLLAVTSFCLLLPFLK